MHTRRNLTSVLLHLPIDLSETSIKSLIVMLDHFADYPEDYLELVNPKQKQSDNDRRNASSKSDICI